MAGMTGHMSRRRRLTGGPRLGHANLAPCPRSPGLNRLTRATVFEVRLFKTRKRTHGTICRPQRK